VQRTTLAPGLTVSRIALGCEPLGGTDWGEVDVPDAMAAVSAAADAGINFFDTADSYGLGRSEERLSQALGNRRHEMVIATKVGVRWELPTGGGRARTYRDSRPQYIKSAVEESLRRLALDSLPLLYLHWPDPATPLQDTVAALEQLKTAGKVRHIALSNFSSDQIAEVNRATPLAAVQVEYNLLNRSAAYGILPTCQALSIPVIAYGPLAQGLLTGKFSSAPQFPATDRRHRLRHFRGEALDAGLATVDALRREGTARNQTPAQLAIGFVLSTPGIACAVAGAKTPEQVRQNAAACLTATAGTAVES
jgi:aryl-alcohol dehydrogenase-like predicted oxidoreductase